MRQLMEIISNSLESGIKAISKEMREGCFSEWHIKEDVELLDILDSFRIGGKALDLNVELDYETSLLFVWLLRSLNIKNKLLERLTDFLLVRIGKMDSVEIAKKIDKPEECEEENAAEHVKNSFGLAETLLGEDAPPKIIEQLGNHFEEMDPKEIRELKKSIEDYRKKQLLKKIADPPYPYKPPIREPFEPLKQPLPNDIEFPWPYDETGPHLPSDIEFPWPYDETGPQQIKVSGPITITPHSGV